MRRISNNDEKWAVRFTIPLVLTLLGIAFVTTLSGCEEWKWGKRAQAVLVDGNR